MLQFVKLLMALNRLCMVLMLVAAGGCLAGSVMGARTVASFAVYNQSSQDVQFTPVGVYHYAENRPPEPLSVLARRIPMVLASRSQDIPLAAGTSCEILIDIDDCFMTGVVVRGADGEVRFLDLVKGGHGQIVIPNVDKLRTSTVELGPGGSRPDWITWAILFGWAPFLVAHFFLERWRRSLTPDLNEPLGLDVQL